MPSRMTLSDGEARKRAVAAQGLGATRPATKVGRRTLLTMAGVVGAIQLDAVNVLERTHFLVGYSRLGTYDRQLLHDVSGRGGALFEYWGHAASLLPAARQPLFRWRMAEHANPGPAAWAQRRRAFQESHADYFTSVLAEVRDRGPLAASQLRDPRRQQGTWWDRRSIGRRVLEVLFAQGILAAWRTTNFERVYDLAERVIPAEILARPTIALPDAQRELVFDAVRAQGVATAADAASYYGLLVNNVKARARELVEDGRLVELAVDGWRDPAYAAAASPTPLRRKHATLLSPFDSLIWDRARTQRIFGFEYRIEIYTPAPQRKYGYYVLPLLFGADLVGRFDLKTDRRASVLLVRASYAEPGVDARTVAPAALVELRSLAAWLGLERVAIARKGNFSAELRRIGREP